MIEKIGQIVIDDTHYPGEDLYCDGVIEDEILNIVKNNPPENFGRIIEEKKNWPILYHLSPLRENIVNWIPVQKTDKVLEVGAGCGAITGALSAKAQSVTSVDLSKKRSLINAYRHPDCDNVTIKLGNFQDVEPSLACDYDYIFLIGVFEYAQSYIGGEKPFETFMAIMKKHLASDGRLVIAIENRFGLKYWAGCKEDHLGTYFDSIEGYPGGGGVRTFTRKALEEICKANGITDYSFYYPYPDYKFMTTIYSDDRLPKVGELSDNLRNFDRDRMLLFDEKNVFDSLIREEMFPAFSNSYLLIIGKEVDVKYARFSNDRAPAYVISTEICEKESKKEVRKIPLTRLAQAHVQKMEETYHSLAPVYEKHGVKLNHCRMDGTEAVFDYLDGNTLEELLDDCLERDDKEGFEQLFETYCTFVRAVHNEEKYNYDLIFSNFIIKDGIWNLIDYEWILEKETAAMTADDMIKRSLYCYSLGSGKRREKALAMIEALYGNLQQQLEEIVDKEMAFQKYATGNRMSMTEIRKEINNPAVPMEPFVRRYMEEEHRNRVQIYEDYGNGFSEENSYFLQKGYPEKQTIKVELPAKPGVKALRFDPSMDYCIVQIKELSVAGEALNIRDKRISCNGELLSEDTIAFATQDANITVRDANQLTVSFEVSRISKEMAEGLGRGCTQSKKSARKGVLWFGK